MTRADAQPPRSPSGRRRVLIVGGVAGGMSAATRLRRRDADAEIIVVERGNDVSFANCGLAYYLGGVITDRATLVPRSPSWFRSRFDLDVRVRTEVVSIDPDARTATLRDTDTGTEHDEHWDELLLATGASAAAPAVDGAEHVLTLRDVTDIDAIAAAAGPLAPGSRAVVIGGGYIGVELADNLVRRGFAVTIVQRGDHLLPFLDVEMSGPVAVHLRGLGVQVLLNSTVERVDAAGATLADGTRIDAALVLAAIGVTPETGLAAASGIRIGDAGGIAVDAAHRTSVPHVFAVGDAAEKVSAITGDARLVALAGPANRDGRYVADTITGTTRVSPPSLGTAIVDVAGLAVATLGITEAELLLAGRWARVIHTHPESHVEYMPGAESLSIKLIIDPESDLILGAQIVGRAGVDKRIDVLATAASAGITASKLADLELAYAPQFGAAKDPVNMLGYIDQNLRDGETETVQWHQLQDRMNAGWQLVDVRTPAEFDSGRIPGAINVPLDELRDGLASIASDRVIVHCQVGQRGHTAARLLRQRGFEAVNLDGGYRTWVSSPAALAAG